MRNGLTDEEVRTLCGFIQCAQPNILWDPPALEFVTDILNAVILLEGGNTQRGASYDTQLLQQLQQFKPVQVAHGDKE